MSPLCPYSPELNAVLQDLKNLTRPLDETGVRRLIVRLGAFDQEISHFEHFNPAVYQRNRIFRSEQVDLLLLCWRPGQRTPLHDHAGSVCGVNVIKGEGTEVAFERSGVDLLIPRATRLLKKGDITVARDSEVHLMGNFSSSRSDLVTLHCYSPPLDRMRVYTQSETFLAEYETVTERAGKSGCYQIQP